MDIANSTSFRGADDPARVERDIANSAPGTYTSLNDKTAADFKGVDKQLWILNDKLNSPNLTPCQREQIQSLVQALVFQRHDERKLEADQLDATEVQVVASAKVREKSVSLIDKIVNFFKTMVAAFDPSHFFSSSDQFDLFYH